MEDYLKTILVIGKEKPVVRAVDISARMRVTKPSVHRAVQLLREEGYIEVSENNHIRLTEQGLMTAQAVNERGGGPPGQLERVRGRRSAGDRRGRGLPDLL